jgi:hypothetical protein
MELDTHVLRLVILINGDGGLAAALGDLNGGDLGGELATLCRGNGLLVRADAVFVLVLAGEAVVVGALLTLQAHVLLLVCVRQAVLQHTIDKRLVSELGASPHDGEVVRGVRHALGAAGDHDIRVAGHDGLRTNDEGLDRRGADLVDGGGYSGLGETSTNCALAGGVLTKAVASVSASSCD